MGNKRYRITNNLMEKKSEDYVATRLGREVFILLKKYGLYNNKKVNECDDNEVNEMNIHDRLRV